MPAFTYCWQRKAKLRKELPLPSDATTWVLKSLYETTLYETIMDGYMSAHICPNPHNHTPPRANSDVNYRLWVVMTCRFTDCHKCLTLVRDVDQGGEMGIWENFLKSQLEKKKCKCKTGEIWIKPKAILSMPWLGHCTPPVDWTFCVPPKFICWNLIPNMMVLGSAAFGRWLGSQGWSPDEWDQCP